MKKILVIGAGPAGLNASIEGAKSGFDVTLVEKGKIGENIRCAEGFFDTMKQLDKPKKGVLFKVENIIIKAVSEYRFSAQRLNLWMIDRSTWQKSLAKEAENLGVKIVQNRPISHHELSKLKREFDYIIDASGAPSVTSRAFGFFTFYKQNSGNTYQYTMLGDFSHIGKNLKVGLLSDFWGYYWIFPKSKDIANVGIGNFSLKNDKLLTRLDDVIKKEDLWQYKIVKTVGGICPNLMPEKLKYDNILLVGDAAGLTSPLHGGGIDMALLSSLEAIKALTYNPECYEKNVKKIFSSKLNFENLLVKVWRQKNIKEMDHLIGNLNKFGIYRLIENPKLISDFSVKLLEKALLNTKLSVN